MPLPLYGEKMDPTFRIPGRPKEINGHGVHVTLYMDSQLLDAIDEIRENISRSKWLSNLAERSLDKEPSSFIENQYHLLKAELKKLKQIGKSVSVEDLEEEKTEIIQKEVMHYNSITNTTLKYSDPEERTFKAQAYRRIKALNLNLTLEKYMSLVLNHPDFNPKYDFEDINELKTKINSEKLPA